MKGNIDFIMSTGPLNLTYRYFSETDEFELVRGEYTSGNEIDPFTLKFLETAAPYAEKIRDLIYLDLAEWGSHVSKNAPEWMWADQERYAQHKTPEIDTVKCVVAQWIDEHSGGKPTLTDERLGCIWPHTAEAVS